MNKVVTILLAAGLSRRMGARNKLLLPVAGVPMIRHMVDLYKRATDGPVWVVTGHDRSKVEHALQNSGAVTVFNPNYADGQMTSVARGLATAPAAEVVLLGLGDQPMLTPADISTLITAHHAGDPARISIPVHGDARGNPIAIPAPLRARLLDDPRAPGCKKFTRQNPQHVQFHTLPARGFYADIDTPEAYENFADLEDAR